VAGHPHQDPVIDTGPRTSFDSPKKVATFVPLPTQHRILIPVPGRKMWDGTFDRKSVISGKCREFSETKIANLRLISKLAINVSARDEN
jgi:hypothetical protein